MKAGLSACLLIFVLSGLIGCETVQGVTKDIGNTARNIRDILGVGRDIERITK